MRADAAQGLVELASGIDALYLSGWAALPPLLCEQLQEGQQAARAAGEAQPFTFGRTEFEIWPHSLGRFPYRLEHRNGVLQLSPNSNLPPIRIQPRAEFLHGVGALGAARWFEDVLVDRCGLAVLAVTRVDLHADFQGWLLAGGIVSLSSVGQRHAPPTKTAAGRRVSPSACGRLARSLPASHLWVFRHMPVAPRSKGPISRTRTSLPVADPRGRRSDAG